MKIVVLDAFHLNPGDLSWGDMKALGEVEIYQNTKPSELMERSEGAEILLSNKVIIDEKSLDALPQLKCICVMATGYNNIDTSAAKKKGIIVCNVRDYSTNSVAQQVFAGVLSVLNSVQNYALEVRSGKWTSKADWSYTNETINNLEGQVLGIIGFGKIGQKVAEIGMAFGMKIISYHKHPERDKQDNVRFVSLDDLLSSADVVTLHAPLNDSTREIINDESLEKMKSSAILVNTGRGPLINESHLTTALSEKKIRAAVLDVMINEPPGKDNPLLKLQNCLITPHLAWAGDKARAKMMAMLIDNVKAFQSGNPINQVN